MNITQPAPLAVEACESCGRTADGSVTWPDATFRACVRCVPVDLLPRFTLDPASPAAEWVEVLHEAREQQVSQAESAMLL